MEEGHQQQQHECCNVNLSAIKKLSGPVQPDIVSAGWKILFSRA